MAEGGGFPVSPKDGRIGSEGAQAEPCQAADAVAKLWGTDLPP